MQESKKLALLRILHILERYSDAQHPLTQEEIVRKLEEDYGIVVDRKLVGRQLSLLMEVYGDGSTSLVLASERGKGVYVEQREFEDSELRLLIDGVLASKHVTAKHSKDLIEKLCRQGNVYFRAHVKNVYSVNEWNKTDNVSVFLNIELIHEAIENGKQLKFVYNKYGTDKQLHKTSNPRVSPYQLILHNQHYYLMARHERFLDMHFYRLDRITDMRVLDDRPATPMREVEGYESGIDYKKLSTALPYLYTSKPEYVEFYVDDWAVDAVVDWFGRDVKIEDENGRNKVSLIVSPDAMEYWALQYLKGVEIISPRFLRERIIATLQNGLNRYQS